MQKDRITIGVMSDTHHSDAAVMRAMLALGDVDAFLHLGDCVEDAEYLQACTEAKVYSVAGNCDFYSGIADERVVELSGVNIFMTHGHRYSVRDDDDLVLDRALELGCKVAAYGHTHCPSLEQRRGVWIMNPGSAFRPRGWKVPTCGLIEIGGGRVVCRLLSLDKL